MNKTLTALLLALTSAWAVDQNPVVEQYSDEMPKSQLVFQGNIPDECYLSDKKYLGYSGQKTEDFLLKTIKNFNFERLYLDPTYWVEDVCRNNMLFVQNNENFLDSEALFLDLKYDQLSLEPVLERLPCKVHESVLTKDKWDYPRKVSHWCGEYEAVNEMSWKYVDLVTHSRPNLQYEGDYFQTCPIEEMFYQIVNKKSLENSVIRAILIFDTEHQYAWNLLYDTEQERKRGENMLMRIKNTFNIHL